MLLRQQAVSQNHVGAQAMSALPAAGLSLVWPLQALTQAMHSFWPQAQVELAASVTSTSAVLMHKVRAPGRVPSLLVAEAQTAGRGRLGRPWFSQPGASLTFSLALPLTPTDWSGLSLAVGVVLAEALDPCQPTAACSDPVRHIGLKWPNDLWLLDPVRPGRKLGGVLVETLTVDEQRWVVLGVGLNVQQPLMPAPQDVRIAALGEWLPELTPPQALTLVLTPVLRALKHFESEGFLPFLQAYAARDLLAGHALTLDHHPQLTSAFAQGVTEKGALRIQSAQGPALIHSGEVSVRPSGPEWGAFAQSAA